MIINKSGIVIRMEVANLRVMGRATQGVRLINLKGNDSIAAVAKVLHDEDDVEHMEDATTPEPTKPDANGTTIDEDSEE